jgi:hypothetical protein
MLSGNLLIFAQNNHYKNTRPSIAGESLAEDCPFELVLSATKGPGLKVELRNRTDRDQPYCHDTFWQSTSLKLSDIAGTEVHCNDRRVIMRPLHPISEGAFGSVGPGGTKELMCEDFEMEEGLYILRWGHATYPGMKAGRYRAVASFFCQRRSWAEERGGPWHEVKDIWTGTMTSNAVELSLP